MKDLVIFHANCLDGLCAAVAVHLYQGDETTDYVGATYGKPAVDVTGYRKVYLVDFCYEPQVLYKLAQDVQEVIVLDHHVNTQAKFAAYEGEQPKNVTLVFDSSVSGAIVTWRYMHQRQLVPMPSLFNYAGDYDLYAFKLEGTRDIAAALFENPAYRDQNVAAFADYLEDFDQCPSGIYEQRLRELRTMGAAFNQLREAQARRMIKRNLTFQRFDGVMVPVINVPHEFASRVGEILSEEHPFAVMYEDQLGIGMRKYSLRSKAGSGVDVGAICVRCGGSGHITAGGFTVPMQVARLHQPVK